MTDKKTIPSESEWDRGFRGEVPDSTPNTAYTVAGVTHSAPTPETIEPGVPGSTRKDPSAPDGRKGS